jgi:MinD superfamily P-loop ATPase
MKIGVASGKGGTGKTTVATSLAAVLSDRGLDVTYVDTDVEEPNGHIFLEPRIDSVEPVYVAVPDVDEAKCTGCGDCGKICQYSAIVVLAGKPLVFDALCHGCGGCWLVCPAGAISRGRREVGVVEEGAADGISFVGGRLRVGEAMSPPLIREVERRADGGEVTVIDVPPGTSCPVVEALKGVDFAVLVTEPTPFGLNDLELAVGMVRELGLAFGVVVNRSDIGDDRVDRYARREGVEILARIPDDRRIAEAYSRGDIIAKALPEHAERFAALYDRIAEEVTV